MYVDPYRSNFLKRLTCLMFNQSRVVTGRGGSGNFRAAPLKLDIVGSYPITAHILAQHEAANLEYESEVIKRHKEAKANKPVSSIRTPRARANADARFLYTDRLGSWGHWQHYRI